MSPGTLVWIKLAAAFVAFAAGIGAVVTAVALAHSTPSADSTTSGPQAAAAPASPIAPETRFPSPPRDALVLAREDRDLAVGLAVSRRGERLALQASVLGPESAAEGLDVAFRAPGREAVQARACGPGCYRAEVPAARAVRVTIRGSGRPPPRSPSRCPAPCRGSRQARSSAGRSGPGAGCRRSSSTTASHPLPGTRSRRCGASQRRTGSRTRSGTAPRPS